MPATKWVPNKCWLSLWVPARGNFKILKRNLETSTKKVFSLHELMLPEPSCTQTAAQSHIRHRNTLHQCTNSSSASHLKVSPLFTAVKSKVRTAGQKAKSSIIEKQFGEFFLVPQSLVTWTLPAISVSVRHTSRFFVLLVKAAFTTDNVWGCTC